MNTSVKTKVTAAILSAICVASAAVIVTTFCVANASNAGLTGAMGSTGSATATATSTSLDKKSDTLIGSSSSNTFTLPIKGEDWNYYADSLNVKVSCDYDYNRSMCNFIFTAVSKGTTNVVLKTQNTDGKWTNTPVRITTDSDLHMTLVQSGNAYITNKPYTETPAQTQQTSSAEAVSTQTASPADTSEAGGTVIAKNKKSPFVLPMKGYDWNYYAASLNVRISCDFDFENKICNFILTAQKPGITDAVLKTKLENGKWSNTPVRITADKELNITVEQTGNAYITDKSFTE